MKKTITLLCAIFTSCVTAIAQPTLTQSTTSPIVGDAFIEHEVDTTGLTVGASGASVTWSYPSLTVEYTDSISYVTCSSTPYCDSFPGSNLASYDNSSYNYYSSTADNFALLGYAVDTTISHTYGHSYDLVYPFTYGSIYKDTSATVQSGMGVYTQYTEMDSVTADAYGTLTTPAGIYTNVLRVHTISINVDSFNFAGTAIKSTYLTQSYVWYVAGFHEPLMFIDLDTSGTGTPYISDAGYIAHFPVLGVGAVQAGTQSLSVYPNPANEVMHIDVNLIDNSSATITVTDLLGNIVNTIHCDKTGKGVNTFSLPTTAMPAGMYLVRLQSRYGSAVQKVIVAK